MNLPKMKFTAVGDMLIQRVISTEYEGFREVSEYIKKGDALILNLSYTRKESGEASSMAARITIPIPAHLILQRNTVLI